MKKVHCQPESWLHARSRLSICWCDQGGQPGWQGACQSIALQVQDLQLGVPKSWIVLPSRQGWAQSPPAPVNIRVLRFVKCIKFKLSKLLLLLLNTVLITNFVRRDGLLAQAGWGHLAA